MAIELFSCSIKRMDIYHTEKDRFQFPLTSLSKEPARTRLIILSVGLFILLRKKIIQ